MPRAEAEIEVYVAPSRCLALLCDVQAHQGLAREIRGITVSDENRPPAEVTYAVVAHLGGQEATTTARFGLRLEGETLRWELLESDLLVRGEGWCRVRAGGEDDLCVLSVGVDLETRLKVPLALQEAYVRETLPSVLERFQDWLESMA